MKVSISIIFILGVFSTFKLISQDTLFMKNGEKIASQVLEISSVEIKYKKANNPDGPTYTSENSLVKYIKYKNGSLDTIKVQPQELIVKTPVKAKSADLVPAKKPPIFVSGFHYRYEGTRIKEKELFGIIGQKHDSEINLYLKKSKRAKHFEYSGLVAIPALAFGIVYTNDIVSNNNLGNIFTGSGTYKAIFTPSIIAGIVTAASLTTTIIAKPIRRKNNEAAIRIYNEKY